MFELFGIFISVRICCTPCKLLAYPSLRIAALMHLIHQFILVISLVKVIKSYFLRKKFTAHKGGGVEMAPNVRLDSSATIG